MIQNVPIGARATARVLLLDERDRLLLFSAQNSEGRRFWVTPGGGVEAGETFEAAAQRELHEETGLALPVARCVWFRRHAYEWEGRRYDQYERFFVARTAETEIVPVKADRYVIGHRWWGLGEIEQSSETFAPRRLSLFLPAILRGEFPDEAIDCGV